MGGGGSKSVKTVVKRNIPPPTSTERQLLWRLTSSFAKGAIYAPSPFFRRVAFRHYRPSWLFRWAALLGSYRPSSEVQEVAHDYYKPSEEFVSTMRNPYLSMLPVQEKLGATLNELASRGVVNSSIASEAFDKIGRWALERALEAKTRTLGLLEEALRSSALDRWQRALALEQLRQHSTSDLWNRLLSLETARQRAALDRWQRALALERLRKEGIMDKYDYLFNTWRTLYAGRMGVPSTYTKQTAPSQSYLAPALGQALGMGLGYWLGPGGGFGKIGGWLGKTVGGFLGGILGV